MSPPVVAKKPEVAPVPPKRPVEVEIEDVVVFGDGKGNFRVSVQRIRGLVVAEKVLEERVSLPVARATAKMWRMKSGALARGIP